MNGARPFSHEVGTWTQGYEAGVRRARRDARVEAFAAIRRAALVARSLDGYDCGSPATGTVGGVMRQAIRSAIGSAKA